MKHINIFLILFVVSGIPACHNGRKEGEPAEAVVNTPVTITGLEYGTISEIISLNATSVYLRKSDIKANTNGYVQKVLVNLGDQVKSGSPLFKMKTKEAEALGLLSGNDTLFGIKGELVLSAPASGIITSITAQGNSYVNDGEVVASMADQKSFVFILHVPFELRGYTTIGKQCEIVLPDSARLIGTISSRLSEVDPVSQTQSYIVTTTTYQWLPENLAVTIDLNRKTSKNAQILLKTCVLSDETMENFWVMKLISDTVAVKVGVKMGISTDTRIEILSPVFAPSERFVNSGSYGLPDTANIVISK